MDSPDSPDYPPKTARAEKLTANLTPTQQSRYEHFLHSKFPNAQIKKLIHQLSGYKQMPAMIPDVIGALAKLFVGQIVEESRLLMQDAHETGRIRPIHLREAHRRLKMRGKIGHTSRQLLRRRF